MTAPRAVECVVVGAGAAGLAAAVAAARHGVQVRLVEAAPAAGGEHLAQMPAGWSGAGARGAERAQAEGRQLIEEARGQGVQTRLGTLAWGIFDGPSVALATGDAAERVAAPTVVLATGGHDRPVPFPGWTLPGVLTAGGVERLLRTYRILPGRQVLVAGSGPWLLGLTRSLVQAGAQVVAHCEAARLEGLGSWRHALSLLPHLDLVRQAHGAWRDVREAGVPILTGHIVRRALGAAGVTGAVVSRCDEAWAPVEGTDRTVEADTVVVGYGSVPATELARAAGCEHGYAADLDAWLPTRSRDLESSVPGIFVAGAAAGAAGAAEARAEGHLVGLAVASRLGKLSGRAWERERARARGRLLHLEGFRRLAERLFRVGPGLYTLADDRTVLCRCEEVTAAAARAAVDAGATHINELKARTRAGMGACQGRSCGPALAHLIARGTGGRVADAGVITARPPVRPVPLGVLAQRP